MAKKYIVAVDAIIEGHAFTKDSLIPDGSRLTVIPDERAKAYVEAGLLTEVEGEEPSEVDPKMLANPPNPYDGSATQTLDANGKVIDQGGAGSSTGTGAGAGGTNDGGVIDPEKFSKPELIAKAKETPNCVFEEGWTKADIAKAINDAVAKNAADAARNGGTNE